jgi:hypothetical protein
MNEQSGINDGRIPALREDAFNPNSESIKVVEDLVKEMPPTEILAKGVILSKKLHAQSKRPLQLKHI